MKKNLIAIILSLALLNFCKSPKAQEADKREELSSFNIEDIPSDWIRLTKTDSSSIIYNTCDGGNTLISIKKNIKGHNLLMHGSQEDYEFEIKNTLLDKNGNLLITATWVDSEEKQNIKFTWIDINSGLGKWETTFQPNYHHINEFVSKEFKDNFSEVEQPCIECWGEKECDLMNENH